LAPRPTIGSLPRGCLATEATYTAGAGR
jgi:hypothetical protein